MKTTKTNSIICKFNFVPIPVLIWVLMCFLSKDTFSQTFECHGVFPNPGVVNEDESQRSDCDRNSTDFLNFYRHKESWIPDENTPIIPIRH